MAGRLPAASAAAGPRRFVGRRSSAVPARSGGSPGPLLRRRRGLRRRVTGPRSATRTAQRWDIPALIVGAGIGGRCAPEHLNHNHFAAASSEASHVVVSDMGHMDVLNGRARAIGRRLCGGGTDPDRARSTVTEILRRYGTR
ncbi:MAG: hypothetical protein KAZ48_04480 [Candidatus Nanopelagicales bacterium]|nr:hypothetical protein [Candidatus Nanopelagicales bacterium]